MSYICFQVETQSWKTELDIQLIAVRMVPSNKRSFTSRTLSAYQLQTEMFYFLPHNIFPVPDDAVDRRKPGLTNQVQ